MAQKVGWAIFCTPSRGHARLAREYEPYLAIAKAQIPRPESTAEYSVTNVVNCG